MRRVPLRPGDSTALDAGLHQVRTIGRSARPASDGMQRVVGARSDRRNDVGATGALVYEVLQCCHDVDPSLVKPAALPLDNWHCCQLVVCSISAGPLYIYTAPA